MTTKKGSGIHAKEYKACLRHIERAWDKLTFHHPKDHYTHFGLPNKFVSPNNEIYKDDQFYWDSYFIILGLVKCGREALAKGMVDNFLSMQKRFNIIPMRNRYYNLGSSQIPFLTSMAREVVEQTEDHKWFKKVMKAAEKELQDYWMNESLTEIHNVYKGLSRYCDHYITHLAAEHESGWDMTSRFNDHCLDYLPVDLNSTLYKYETDLAAYYKSSRNTKKHRQYAEQAEARRSTMNKLMWDDKKGFYFDYDYKHKKRSKFFSVAGFYPMWAGIATHEQAERMRASLKVFEYKGGLANTQSTRLAHEHKQHDYPNGWPQQQWMVVKGLSNYGFTVDALRIANKFLDLTNQVYKKTGKIWEKYNVVKCEKAEEERYPTQSGFAWTNAVFIRLINKFGTR